MNAPRCKKCGRVLRDPVSIACGMGPKCRGESGSSSSSRLPKATARRQRRYARTVAFASGNPITMGDLTYRKNGNKWIADQGGTLSDERLKSYLCHYGLIKADDLDRILAAGPEDFLTMNIAYQTQESKS